MQSRRFKCADKTTHSERK